MTPSPSAKCTKCSCTWGWHQRWFKTTIGHQTEAGYCSCIVFRGKDGTIVGQPVQPEPIAPHDEYDHLRESAREDFTDDPNDEYPFVAGVDVTEE